MSILLFFCLQCPNKHQVYIAHVLGIPQHKVVVRTKRLGGGFGGKESRSAFLNATAAVPAYLLRRPVRLVLDRDEDMAITGHRHPFMARYKVGFTPAGKLTAFDGTFYSNAGNSLDLSTSIMDRALMSSDSTYKFQAFRVKVRKRSTMHGTSFLPKCAVDGCFMFPFPEPSPHCFFIGHLSLVA